MEFDRWNRWNWEKQKLENNKIEICSKNILIYGYVSKCESSLCAELCFATEELKPSWL